MNEETLKRIHGFVEALNALVANLNRDAEQAQVFDPLQEISFTIERSSPGGENRLAPGSDLPMQVRIIAAYLSGGGIESSYQLNDEVTLAVGPEGIDGISFVRDMESIDQPAVPLEDAALAKFLVRIESFLSVIIPENL